MVCLALFGRRGKKTRKTVTNRKIPVEDITDFYYTRENSNFNASYQRYRFFKEDEKYTFYHETRKKPGEYGPTTEKDITSKGAAALSEDEWQDFLSFLKDGTVNARKKSAESGGSGPWTFLYWKNDKGKYQEFGFPSYKTRIAFEEFCSALSKTER